MHSNTKTVSIFNKLSKKDHLLKKVKPKETKRLKIRENPSNKIKILKQTGEKLVEQIIDNCFNPIDTKEQAMRNLEELRKLVTEN